MQKLEETELRKADRTVGVNCNIFSNISSGRAWRNIVKYITVNPNRTVSLSKFTFLVYCLVSVSTQGALTSG